MWNIANIEPKFSAPVSLADAVMSGLSNEQQLQRQKIANKAAQTNLNTLADMNKARLNAINQGNALTQARINLMDEQSQNPYRNVQPTGVLAQQMFVNNMANRLGATNPLVQKLQEGLNLTKQTMQTQNAFRQGLANTYQQRALSPLGKTIVEQQNIAQHGTPFPGNANASSGIPIPENQRQQYLNQYELKRIKDTTDSANRQRLLNANSIDNTIAQIDPNAISKYAGLENLPALGFQKALSMVGKESPAYDDYVTNLNKLEGLAQQMRKFYGDSISPETHERLKKMLDYNELDSNPKLWTKNYNALVSVYKNDKKAYQEGMTNPDAYEGFKGAPPEVGSVTKEYTYNPNTGKFE
jgi:hypothetical protein